MAWRIVYLDRILFLISSLINILGFKLIVIGLILTLYLTSKRIRNWYNQRKKLIEFSKTLPGPPTLPLIGNALQFACSPDGK